MKPAPPETVHTLGGSAARAFAGALNVWRRPARILRSVGPIYRSTYLNTVLAGDTEDGRPFALVAGTHSRNYPFRDHKSRWDDLLLLIGDEVLTVSARHISDLGITLNDGKDACIFFHGRASTPRGAAINVDLSINLEPHVLPPLAQGLGFRYLLLGLLWQPALVRGSGSITVREKRVRITNVNGEMERGALTNVSLKAFQFSYKYTALAKSNHRSAYVEFTAGALHEGLLGLPVTSMLRVQPVHVSSTITQDGYVEGDRDCLLPLPGERVTVLASNRVELGPARAIRELIRVGDGAAARDGLREIIGRTAGDD